MINNISYTATANKTNGTSTLDAAEWNALSQAVAGIAGSSSSNGVDSTSGNTSIESASGKNVEIYGRDRVYVESDSTNANSMELASMGGIIIRTNDLNGVNQRLYLNAGSVAELSSGKNELTSSVSVVGASQLTVGSGRINIETPGSVNVECGRFNATATGSGNSGGITMYSDEPMQITAGYGGEINFYKNLDADATSFNQVTLSDLIAIKHYFESNPNLGVTFSTQSTQSAA